MDNKENSRFKAVTTAADKIRSMNNDELAEFLAQIGYTCYKTGLEHAIRFKKRMIDYDMLLEANKTMLNKDEKDVSFGALPGMGKK